MENKPFRFQVGSFRCFAVCDGYFTYAPPMFPPPGNFLFSNAPESSLDAALNEYTSQREQRQEWTSPYICLLVDTGKNLVLVDTGAGGLSPTTGKLISTLMDLQIYPGDIDTVIITHGHPDHLGGNMGKDGKEAFPNARFVIWKDEWDFWTSGQAEQTLDEHTRETLVRFAQANLLPIKDQVTMIDREVEIVSGISAVAAPGHTPGHMVLSIASGDDRLLCISDTILHPVHLEHPEWHAMVDVIPEKVVTTRRRILNEAATGNCMVIAFHLTFPGLGHVARKGAAWQWQPVVIQP